MERASFSGVRLCLWTSCCGEMVCCLSTHSPSLDLWQETMRKREMEEKTHPPREKLQTDELGKNRKPQGDMRVSTRDWDCGGGGRSRERQMHPSPRNCRGVCPTYQDPVQGPEGESILVKDTQQVTEWWLWARRHFLGFLLLLLLGCKNRLREGSTICLPEM